MSGLRGIVGIEAAIVLIAFVLVASALAFVAINMGMFSAQKSKEVMAKAYDTATRALDVAGDALAHVDTTSSVVDAVVLPIKLSGGSAPIDLNKTVVTLIASNGTSAKMMANAYKYISGITFKTVTNNITTVITNLNNFNATWVYATNVSKRGLLGPGEVALLVVKAPIQAYGWIQIEVKPPIGAPLAVRYSIPPVLTSQWIDLVLGQ